MVAFTFGMRSRGGLTRSISNALTAKAFPPREPGNPAAGTTRGSGLEVQTYFKKCVANGGRMDNSTDGH